MNYIEMTITTFTKLIKIRSFLASEFPMVAFYSHYQNYRAEQRMNRFYLIGHLQRLVFERQTYQTTELMKTKKEKNHMKQSELVSVVLNNE